MIDNKENMIYEDNKSLRFMMRMSVVLFIVTLICNIVLPVFGRFLHPDVFNIVIEVCWTYGMLSSLGYFKKPVLKEGKRVEYETTIPVVPIGMIRVIQLVYHLFLKKSSLSVGLFIALVVIDVIYVFILLLDKSSYYYESVEREMQDYTVTIVEDDQEDLDD